jgi:hypothetical protein
VKTSVVQLETHDDYLSVRDRLNWIKGGRVLLIWPKRARSLERRLDLVLLQHYAASLGLQVGLVTKDPEVRYHASELGIPTFDSNRQAQSERWPRRYRPAIQPEHHRPRPDFSTLRRRHALASPGWTQHPLVRGIFFTLSILAVLAIALLLIPEAQITLTPKTETQSLVLDVSASPNAQAITLAGDLPTHPVSVILDGSATIQASGTITVPSGYASGNIKLTNLSAITITVPAGSIVSTPDTPPLRFATRQEAQIPAGPGRTVSVMADALTAGTIGNVPAGRIITLEGPLSFQVTATNPLPLHGGSHESARAPTQADFSLLYDQLLAQLEITATAALQASLLAGDQLISTAVLTDTIEKLYTPATAQPAEQLALTLRLQFSGLAVSADDLHQWAEAVLDASLPAGYTPIVNSLSIRPLTAPDYASNIRASWQIEAKRQIQAHISAQTASILARWHPIEQAKQALATLPLTTPPMLNLSPTWWPFVPLRIRVNTP